MSDRPGPGDELKLRREHALGMGGPARVDKQHARGKLAVRERIDRLLDTGSFREYGQLASHHNATPDAHDPEAVTPADGLVTGFGTIEGRSVCIAGEDFTVKGGTYGIVHGRKKLRCIEIASRERVPIVWILDGAGARAQEMVGEGLPTAPHLLALARHSGVAPLVAVVAGPSAGDSSLVASLCHFIVMVEGTSMLAAGGPPVVKAATGQDVDKESLGGADIHCRISGVADNRAADEDQAFDMVCRFLSYFPLNAWQYPPAQEPAAPAEADAARLDTVMPEDRRRPYDMKQLIRGIVDRDSFFEVKPEHAAMLITGLARIEGHPVGIVANQPLVQAGAITGRAAHKARHFIDLCSSFHVPLIFLQDVPGVMPGPESEKEGALRPALAMTWSLVNAQVPTITVVVRKAFGYGACAMAGGGAGQTIVLAWPGATFASLPASSAAHTVHREEIEQADDPAALLAELIERYERCAGPIHAASNFNIDDVVYPAETRDRLAEALKLARNRRCESAGPVARYGVMP
jgi:acetyl-CoA carboxylase carboxyltransferase component